MHNAYRVFAVVLPLLLVAAVAPARAETISLACTNLDTGGPYTNYGIEVDLGTGVVRYSAGATYPIDSQNDRYIYYGGHSGRAPNVQGSPWRLDRQTGAMEILYAAPSDFRPYANCRP